LSDRDTRELQIEAVDGLGRTGHQARLLSGQSAMARVIETGRQIIVPRLSVEPSLAQQLGIRLGAGEERSFLCLPIAIDRQTVGALGVCLKFDAGRNYERSSKFF